MINDYRCVDDGNVFENTKTNKELFMQKVKTNSPKIKNIYNYISDNKSDYKKDFMKIYKYKCAYCGCNFKVLTRIDQFEIDHFICKSFFQLNTHFIYNNDFNNINNLILSCKNCNRNKHDIIINNENFYLLHPDEDNIQNVFKRDENFYIVISDKYKKNDMINEFYHKLKLDGEDKRLDFLIMDAEAQIEKISSDNNTEENYKNNKLLEYYKKINNLKKKRFFIC